jgi:hypothetical protein
MPCASPSVSISRSFSTYGFGTLLSLLRFCPALLAWRCLLCWRQPGPFGRLGQPSKRRLAWGRDALSHPLGEFLCPDLRFYSRRQRGCVSRRRTARPCPKNLWWPELVCLGSIHVKS